MSKSSPIAVFDTGAGGLSVVNILRNLLPNENIYYFADTANLPYGTKSPELISHLSLKMAKKIVEISSCKLLVIACHTVSVWCLKEIKESLSIPVVGMVEPSVSGLKQLMAQKAIASVGILSTKATLISKTYRSMWPSIDPKNRVTLVEHASSPLVSLVEEEVDLAPGEIAPIINQFIPTSIKQCDALLIGCTHFSALKPALKRVLKPGCEIVDGALLAAQFTKDLLINQGLITNDQSLGQFRVYISDNKERFVFIAKRFIEDELAVTMMTPYAGH
jgi:glutamate racemase